MDLQKRLAAQILGCGPKRVKFDPSKLTEIKEAITKFDIARLINKGTIYKAQSKGVSRARAKKIAVQKSKGRQGGHGSRKGSATARLNPKKAWVAGIRNQREFLKQLRSKGMITQETFKQLYAKSKGGFFRSSKHMKIYMNEQNMFVRKDGKR